MILTGRDSLWFLISGPVVWVAHFLLRYLTAAIWCAKAGRAADLGVIRIWIAAVTIAALAAIALTIVQALRKWGFPAEPRPPHDRDTPEDRRRFLGYATLLLGGLSFVAVIYVALPALFIGTCR